MTHTITTYYAYGVYVVRAKQEKWLECYFIGQQGSDVLMESNVLVKVDDRMQGLDKEIERYGCFETLDLQPHRLQLVRTLTEAEKDEWNEWHHLYRELKWKIKSIQSQGDITIQECKEELSIIQQMAEHLQKSYPVSPGEKDALSSLLDDIHCMIAEFVLEEDADVEEQEASPAANQEESSQIAAATEQPVTEPAFPQAMEKETALIPTSLEQDIIDESMVKKSDFQEIQPTHVLKRGEEEMKAENTIVLKSLQTLKEESQLVSTNIYHSLYENKELTEYFRRFAQLCDATAPLAQTEDATVQRLLTQLHIELAWIKTKVLRSLGIYAVHSENKIGELEFIELREGLYANNFQTIMMHALFDSFGKAVKDSASAFDMQKNTMIRMLLELFRDEPASTKNM